MFRYVDGRLHCEDVDMAEIGRTVGTPCYIYSSRSILDAWLAYDGSFDGVPHMICYAVKANSTLAVLSLLARAGFEHTVEFAARIDVESGAGAIPAAWYFPASA